jgi:hypothetical protein
MASKIKVAERAIMVRLNRKLHGEDLMVKKTREGTRARFDLGEFYTINWRLNALGDSNIDLEDWARHHGALKDWEEIDFGTGA